MQDPVEHLNLVVPVQVADLYQLEVSVQAELPFLEVHQGQEVESAQEARQYLEVHLCLEVHLYLEAHLKQLTALVVQTVLVEVAILNVDPKWTLYYLVVVAVAEHRCVSSWPVVPHSCSVWH